MEDTDVTVRTNGKEVEHLQAEIVSVGFDGFYFETGSCNLVAVHLLQSIECWD